MQSKKVKKVVVLSSFCKFFSAKKSTEVEDLPGLGSARKLLESTGGHLSWS